MSLRRMLPVAAFYIFVVLAVLLTGILTGYCNEKKGKLLQVATFEGGTAYKTSENIYWTLSLAGTWRAMGRQYGGLVGEDLKLFCREITADVAARGMDKAAQLEVARLFAGSLTAELRELLRGIAETSGLSEDEVLLVNAGMLNLSGAVLGSEAPSACSGIAAWGKYTPDGGLVFGRNWDIDRDSMKKYMKYLSVVVFKPASGNSLANVHPLGNVYLETGINNKGLFLELNNGAYSDANAFEERENTVATLVSVLNRCNTLEEAAKYLAAVPADLSYIIQLADWQESVSVERPTFDSRVRRCNQKGLLAAYNSFIPPYPKAWAGKIATPRSPKEDPRYENLLNLANSTAFYGKLAPAGMKRLLDVKMEDGGATHKGSVLQVIAVPKDLKLWIRGLDYSDWQEVDLKELFN